MEFTEKFTKKNRYRIADTCPCGKSNKDGKFGPFDGYEDKGKCFSCGKTFWPENTENFKPDNGHKYQEMKQPNYVNEDILNRSMSGYEKNTFYQYMVDLVGVKAAKEIRDRYKLGTTKKGGVVFWLIDINGNIRQPKVMTYNQEGHKIRTYVQSGYSREYGFTPCMFGEHLIKDNNKPIYLLESEKSACLASFGFPQFTWVASGGAAGLTKDKAEALRGYRVLIIPDADTAGREGAKQSFERLQSMGIQSKAIDLFSDREDGYDIADYVRDKLKSQIDNATDIRKGNTNGEFNQDFYFGENGFLREELDKGLLIAV